MLGCYNLAMSYEKGTGVEQSYERALELYNKACDAEDVGSCEALAFLYDHGEGVEQSSAIADQFHRKACDAGSETSCERFPHQDPKKPADE